MPVVAYRHYLLAVLTFILLFNYVDRWALSVVLESIKTDLQLSDTQLGLLSGIAFALFYSVMGIPLGRWADRGDRVLIVTLTIVLWSVGVALCGVAQSFTQLLLIRVAVAVGEAGCIPAGFSLIADYFNRAERPRAAAIYGMGAALSFVVGFLGAGWLNQAYGWRVTFMVLAAPGAVLAVLSWFTLREPRRANVAGLDAHAQQPSLRTVAATLRANATFRHLLMSLSIMYFTGYGVVQWQPAFFIRSHELTSAQVGLWMALANGIGGLIGTYVGGEWATRRASNNERLQLRAMAAMIFAAGTLSMFIYIAPNVYLAFGLIGSSLLCFYMINGPLYATIQALVPERMRAVAIAIVYLVANLIGMGLGPLAAGALSDLLHRWVAEESLRYSLLILTPGNFLGAWHAWQASKSVRHDLARVQQGGEGALAPQLQGKQPRIGSRPAVELD